MSLTTLISSLPTFLPGDVYHSYLVEFTSNITNQNSSEDAMIVIQAQMAKPLVDQLTANMPKSGLQSKRKRSAKKR